MCVCVTQKYKLCWLANVTIALYGAMLVQPINKKSFFNNYILHSDVINAFELVTNIFMRAYEFFKIIDLIEGQDFTKNLYMNCLYIYLKSCFRQIHKFKETLEYFCKLIRWSIDNNKSTITISSESKLLKTL